MFVKVGRISVELVRFVVGLCPTVFNFHQTVSNFVELCRPLLNFVELQREAATADGSIRLGPDSNEV